MTTWTGTAPTFAAGDNATVVSNLNTLRDAIKALSETWTSFAVSWTASAGTPSVGNGSLTGAYCRINKLVHFRIELVFGSTTSMGTAGSTQRFALPVAPASSQRHRFPGTAYDNGTADYTTYWRYNSAGPYLEVACQPTTAGAGDRLVTNTVPFTWGSTDVLMVQGSYEGA